MTDSIDSSLPERPAAIPPFGLGDWTVHPSLNRITDGTTTEGIEPRMMHVLVCLASAPGQVISRQTLLDVVWSEAIVGEEVLTRAVSRLRVLFGDDSRNPRYFETIRGGGYRLLMEPAPVESAPLPEPATSRRGSRHIGLAAGVLIIVTIFAGIWLTPEQEMEPSLTNATPFFSMAGGMAFPAFSPDNKTVVFYWSGGADEDSGLFLKQVDNEQPRRLTESEGVDSYPVFSPDGSTVAFVRRIEGNYCICTVSALGGATRVLTEMSTMIFGLSWSPVDNVLVFAGTDEQSGESCLLALDLSTLASKPITKVNLKTHTGESWPVFSPDGKSIAFARCDHAGLRELWLVPASGGPGRQITEGLNIVTGLSWLPDGREIIVAAGPNSLSGLWRVRLDDGSYSKVPIASQEELAHPTMANNGSAMVFRSRKYNYDLLKLDLDQAVGQDSSGIVENGFAVSTRNESSCAWSPLGDRVVFVSDRSGFQEVWIADADGSNMRRLSNWRGVALSRLFWAPDGRRIAVNVMDATLSWIEIIDTATGTSHSLGEPGRHQRCCGWSDNDRVSAVRDEDTSWKLLRIQVDGSAEEPCELKLLHHPVVLETDGGFYYQTYGQRGLWRSPTDGSTGVQIISGEEMPGWVTWTGCSDVLFVIRRTAAGETIVESFDPVAKTGLFIAEVPARSYGLSASPDGRHLMVTVLEDYSTELMVVLGPFE